MTEFVVAPTRASRGRGHRPTGPTAAAAQTLSNRSKGCLLLLSAWRKWCKEGDLYTELHRYMLICSISEGKSYNRVRKSNPCSASAISQMRLSDALDFRTFMRRKQTLKLFRDLLRASPDMQTRAQIRASFESHRSVSDPLSLRALMMDGKRTLDVLNATKVHRLSGPSSGSRNASADAVASGEKDRRVGEGWPWER